MQKAPKITSIKSPLVIAIVGPTGSGKTALALSLAKKLDAEIVSCDSRGVYKGLPTLTAVPPGKRVNSVYKTSEGVPYHLVDFLSPAKRYDAWGFARTANKLIAKILQRKKFCVLAGGSGFYFRVLTRGLNPLPGPDKKLRNRLENLLKKGDLAALQAKLKILDPATFKKIDAQNPRRVIRALELCLKLKKPLSLYLKSANPGRQPPYAIKSFYLSWPKEMLKQRVAKRIAEGFDAMTRELMKLKKTFNGRAERLPAFEALLAKPIWKYINGELSRSQAEEECLQKDLNYAKRQKTWFKKEPGLHIIEAAPVHFLKNASNVILKEIGI